MYVSGHLPIEVSMSSFIQWNIVHTSCHRHKSSNTISLNHSLCITPTLIQVDGKLITGALGPDDGGLTVEQGYAAARLCGLNIISTLKNQLGDLDRVEQVIKVRFIMNFNL